MTISRNKYNQTQKKMQSISKFYSYGRTISVFLIMLYFCAFTATAQHQLSGTIKDASDGSPVPFATAALLRADSTVVTGVMADADGKFALANVAAGDYILQLSFVGYNKEYRRVNVPAQSDLGEISLAESATRLQEVVVTAARPLVAMRADRYVVNVSGNIQSAGRNAMDILRNTPGLLVNRNGDISAMGNSVHVWIDGRPSRMSGEQLQAFLASMQGDEIDRIEVITNPSSRYDAAGGGGIIDIRTKKGLQFGVNGTLTLDYRQGRMDSENAGVNLNWRREKFNMFGNYSVGRSNGWEKISQVNVMQTPVGEITFDQNATAKNSKAGLRNSVRAGVDYFPNTKNILGVIVNAYHSDIGNVFLKGITNIIPAYNGVSYSEAYNVQSRSSNGIQINANYQATFAKPGQRLNLDLDYARFSAEPFQQNRNMYYDLNNLMIGIPEQLSNSNLQTIEVYSAKIDYMQPLWKNARMETGAKVSQSKTDNDMKFEVFTDNGWQIDVNRTNRFVYTEQIDAAYINISQQLGKFNLQAGLRGEYTLLNSEQKTTNELNDTTYFNLFPTFFANYQPSQKHSFGISYSRRLSRPSYYELNPFEVAIDAYSFTRGNPHLKPSYTHNVQFSHTFAQSLMTRIGYSSTTDLIVLIPIIDDATQRYGTTRGNFGKNQYYFGMANYRRQIVNIWTANMTVQGGYGISTSKEASDEFVNKGGSLYVQLNNNITITPTLSAELTGWYQSSSRSAYYVAKSRGNFSIGFRQTLLNNKITLSLTVNDIFYTTKERISAKYENVNYTLVSARDNRYANLTLRYNFGSTTVRAARSKQTGIEDETTRAGGR